MKRCSAPASRCRSADHCSRWPANRETRRACRRGRRADRAGVRRFGDLGRRRLPPDDQEWRPPVLLPELLRAGGDDRVRQGLPRRATRPTAARAERVSWRADGSFFVRRSAARLARRHRGSLSGALALPHDRRRRNVEGVRDQLVGPGAALRRPVWHDHRACLLPLPSGRRPRRVARVRGGALPVTVADREPAQPPRLRQGAVHVRAGADAGCARRPSVAGAPPAGDGAVLRAGARRRARLQGRFC